VSKAYVYGLRIVGTDEIRYIGHSTKPRRRLRTHIVHDQRHYTEANPALGLWLDEAGDGLRMVILEETTKELAREREEAQIRHHMTAGHRLLNVRAAARRIYTTEEAVEIMKRYEERDNEVREERPPYHLS
jgi:predicted GIY-YIG superfamily endonuclease